MKNTEKFIQVFLLAGLITLSTGYGEGLILIFAIDSSSTVTTVPPPSAVAVLDEGATNLSFGTSYSLLTPWLDAGTHLVEVTTAEGYLPRESGSVSGAVDDPNSLYGNPRYVNVTDDDVSQLTFMFDPYMTVKATVRDAWTMERLDGAGIEFVVNSGVNSNLVYCKYPWHGTYATNWSSGADGSFPSNTYLYVPDNYDLTITNTGYQTFTSNNVVTTNSAPGDTVDLGNIFLLPIDSNTNQIADAWETLHFNGSNVVADADADGDGMNNRAEYVAGTDPTNALSNLLLKNMDFSNDQLEMTWETASWRTYRVTGCTDLCGTDSWAQVGGTWEATNGQAQMSWVETNLNLSWNSNYRVEVVPCYWQGTNQVLVNTNNWSGGGGGGTGTNTPPIP